MAVLVSSDLSRRLSEGPTTILVTEPAERPVALSTSSASGARSFSRLAFLSNAEELIDHSDTSNASQQATFDPIRYLDFPEGARAWWDRMSTNSSTISAARCIRLGRGESE